MLAPIDVVFAIGHSPERTLRQFAGAVAQPLLWPQGLSGVPGNVIAWFVSEGRSPFSMQAQGGRAERIRHLRKYAEGNMRYHSFYFRGPDGRHNIKAHNLAVFCQIAAGIDEPTWLFHLRRNDYSAAAPPHDSVVMIPKGAPSVAMSLCLQTLAAWVTHEPSMSSR